MSVTKISEKFTDKKSKFNQYITHPEIFDCDDFNIIKLFQYAIFREEGFNARPYWKWPFFLIQLLLFVKRLRIKNKPHFKTNIHITILAGDTHRSILNNEGKFKSRYFENILNYLNKEKTLFVNTNIIPSGTTHDASFNEFYEYYSVLPLTNDDKRLLKHLKKTYQTIISKLNLDTAKIKIFEEIIQIFWQQYRAYRKFLEHYPNIKVALVFPHYQMESLIYALRRRQIKIIELQHGLIAKEDMFYVYDKNIVKVREKALFADEIWTYGKYWKNVLLNGYEYDEKQIKVFGYYPFYEKNFSKEFERLAAEIKNKYPTIIFATAQKNLEHHLAEYLNFLLKDTHQKKQNIALIIKPHPSASQDIADFLIKDFGNVFVVNYPMEWLFQICHIHISIYSTTLFDALMFNIKNNFALNHPLFSDYVEGICKQGIAQKLEMHENVMDKVNIVSTQHSAYSPEYFYQSPDYSMLSNLSRPE
ncbi:MAG: hypothetical protein KatS3mg028_1221 [Bacteroidia bacterium]|nr:MAG: hypothetical protein KatS3mg028_1221 [Bacteroidia bacterium]